MNLLFGLKLKYFNGVTVLPTLVARELKPSDGFSYAAENLVRLIKLFRYDYIEIPAAITERKSGQSKAFKFKNIRSVFLGVGRLFIDVHFRGAPPKLTNSARGPYG
jgi:hypothetical protein